MRNIGLRDNVDPPEPKVIATCEECKGNIYEGEEYGVGDDGFFICSDCIDDVWNALTFSEKLELFNYRYIQG